MEIYHQLGFREKWNFDVYKDDSIGEGFIFSPVNLSYEKLKKIDSDLKKVSVFDPQYFLPDKSPKGKLSTYPYFPKILCDKDYLTTNDMIEPELSSDVAKECIELQIKEAFSSIIIPFKKSHENDYAATLEKQEKIYINPFLNYIKEHCIKKDIYLTLIISEDELIFETIRDYFLNWITKFSSKVKGIYLIFENKFNSKQIKSSDYLFNALCFIHQLKENDFNVIIGYTNTEALIYSLANPDGITLGSYENLRKFSYERFIEKNDSGPRMPKARMYSDKLLHWIPHGLIESMQTLAGEDFSGIFSENKYYDVAFSETFKWHFTKPELYKHYFFSFYHQLKNIPENRRKKFDYVKELIVEAHKSYQNLEDYGILFGIDSDSSHLQPWLIAVKSFEKYLIEEDGSL